MTLDQLASVGEIVGAIGVVMSLAYLAIFFQCFRYFENMFYRHKKGYLDEEVWTGWKRLMLTYYSRPGFQTWWKHRRDVFSESFAIFLETEKLDREIATYHEISNLGSP